MNEMVSGMTRSGLCTFPESESAKHESTGSMLKRGVKGWGGPPKSKPRVSASVRQQVELCCAENAVGRRQTKTYLSQFFHRLLAYPILFEHDLRRVDDVVNRLLDNAALSWFSDGLSVKDWESMNLARAD